MSIILYAVAGKDYEETVVFENNDGSIKDLTGYTSEIKVAKYYGTSNTITISGQIELPETNGIVKYSCSKEILQSLGYGSHVYSRYLYNSLGEVDSVVSGNFVIIPSVI